MPKLSRDPLLAAAQLVLAIFAGLIMFAITMVVLGAGAVATIQRAEVAAKIAEAGVADAIGVWSIFAGLLALGGLLFMALRFTVELGEIVKSVDQGDPFTPVNAQRLTRMGWLALAVYLGGLALASGQARLERLAGSTHPASSLTGVVVGGMMLVLTLFILARVFRKGTEMREELEGTV
jgi:HAMP domain-containing protein